MNRRFVKKIATVMVCALLVTMSAALPEANHAMAASKVRITRSTTVYVGCTKTIKLTNNKKTVKWSISKGSRLVRIGRKTKTSVKVRGLKTGTARIRAKIGKKSYYCKVVVKKCPHKTTYLKNVVQPTCREEGYSGDTFCRTCGIKRESGHPVDRLKHTLTRHEAISKTCTEDGSIEYYSCDGCGGQFADAEAETELSSSELAIPASHILTHHAMVAATCTKNGSIEYYSCNSCSRNYADAKAETELSSGGLVIPASHMLTHHKAAGATCTSDGNIEYYSCSRCSKNYADAKAETELSSIELIIPAFHVLTHHDAVDATCTSDGNIEYYSCSRCGGLFRDASAAESVTGKDTVVKAHHTWENDVCKYCQLGKGEIILPGVEL